jgi:hypothetical protein
MCPGKVLRKGQDLPIEQDLGQFEELMAHFNTGWPMAGLNHLQTLLQMASRLLPVPWEKRNNSIVEKKHSKLWVNS